MQGDFYIISDEQGKILAFGSEVQGDHFNNVPDDMYETVGLNKYLIENEVIVQNPDYQDCTLTQQEIQTLIDRDGYVNWDYWSIANAPARYQQDFGV